MLKTLRISSANSLCLDVALWWKGVLRLVGTGGLLFGKTRIPGDGNVPGIARVPTPSTLPINSSDLGSTFVLPVYTSLGRVMAETKSSTIRASHPTGFVPVKIAFERKAIDLCTFRFSFALQAPLQRHDRNLACIHSVVRIGCKINLSNQFPICAL